MFGGGPPGRQAGRELAVGLAIELTEAYRGCRKTVSIRREELCTDCGGSGSKPGSRPATCRRCRGQGVVLMSQGFFRMQQTCPGCGGRGEIITDPCSTCHGGGR